MSDTLPFISDFEKLSQIIELDKGSAGEIEAVSRVYPFRVPLSYGALIEKGNPSCPIRRQAIPSIEELAGGGVEDPLGEKGIEVAPSFFKRYPNRGVFLATDQCAMYCRFCNRKRLVGRDTEPQGSREETFEYLQKDRGLNEVIVSGGDPLMLDPPELDYLLSRLKAIDHLTVIRVSTRMPVVFPARIEPHIKAISKHSPLWLILHVNHPREINRDSLIAIKALREAGCTIVSQTVLLRGVNDCEYILGRLFEGLVRAGVKPYYLFQLDEVMGAGHFKVRIETGIAIMRKLRANLSGLCIPQYAVDITGGLGKVPIDYRYLRQKKGRRRHFENLNGEKGVYADSGKESRCLSCGICTMKSFPAT